MVFDLFGCGAVFLKHRSVYKMLCAVCCRSIKHYFLLDKGDFIVQFMDMTEEEMKQNIDDILLSAAMLFQQNKMTVFLMMIMADSLQKRIWEGQYR